MELPLDIYTCLFNFLDSKSIAMLTVVNKLSKEAFQKRKDNFTFAGKYRLKHCQQYIVKLISQGYNIGLSAPMSWGKTAVGLASALCNYKTERSGPVWLIVVPSKAIHTWKDEVVKMYGYEMFKVHDINSPIVIINSSVSKVHNSITHLSGISKFTHLVIVSGSKHNLQYDTDFNLVVDEAHTCNKWKKLYSSSHKKKFLLLSASTTNEDEYVPVTKNNKRIEIVWDHTSGVVPIPIHNYYIVDKIEKRPVPIKSRVINTSIYVEAVENLIKQARNVRTVIFLPGGMYYDDLAHKITNICTMYGNTVHHYSSTATLARFEKYLNSVLLITHAASESININAELCITIRIDWINNDRIIQTIGRCLRTTNPNKNVHVFHILPDCYPKYKVMYSNACGLVGGLPCEELEPIGLINAFKMLNIVTNDYTPADIVAVCDQENKFKIEWWKKQQSNVPDNLKLKMISH